MCKCLLPVSRIVWWYGGHDWLVHSIFCHTIRPQMLKYDSLNKIVNKNVKDLLHTGEGGPRNDILGASGLS